MTSQEKNKRIPTFIIAHTLFSGSSSSFHIRIRTTPDTRLIVRAATMAVLLGGIPGIEKKRVWWAEHMINNDRNKIFHNQNLLQPKSMKNENLLLSRRHKVRIRNRRQRILMSS